jgi:signal transduction histidine kinase
VIDVTNLADIVDGFSQGYLLVNPKGDVVALGSRALEMLGITERNAAGRHVAGLFPIIGVEAAIFEGKDSVLQRCLRTGAEFNGPISGIRVETAGGPRYLNIQIRRMTWGGALVLVADVGAVREVLDAHDALVSVTSHELKTPLTAIKAMSELMLAYELGDGERREMIGDIYKQAERLEMLIKEILDASHLDSGRVDIELAPVNLRNAVAEVIDDLETQLDGRKLRIILEKGLPLVEADPAKLRQILVNLISNAIKYSPESAGVRVQAAAKQNRVRISVKDQGIGIKKEDRDRLFKRFQRIPDPANRKTAGTGLGLYIVKGLVELHGGEVSVTSTYGKGSTFSFTLPAIRPAKAVQRVARARAVAR